MSKNWSLFFTLIAFFCTYHSTGQADEPAFEAYFKFVLGGVHSGYTVQRFEIDTKKKQMTSTYYTFVKTPTGSTTESLTAKSDMNFEPISYKYTALVDGTAKVIDASFKNKKMNATVQSGKNKITVKLDVPPSGFMSTFLNYVILKNGMAVGKSYGFRGLAEETPACLPNEPTCKQKEVGFVDGTVLIKSEEKFKGLDAYRLDILYKGIPFKGYVNAKGETLGTNSELQNASTEIVRTKAEAVGSFPFNGNHIKALFGQEPKGIKNALYATTEKKQ